MGARDCRKLRRNRGEGGLDQCTEFALQTRWSIVKIPSTRPRSEFRAPDNASMDSLGGHRDAHGLGYDHLMLGRLQAVQHHLSTLWSPTRLLVHGCSSSGGKTDVWRHQLPSPTGREQPFENSQLATAFQSPHPVRDGFHTISASHGHRLGNSQMLGDDNGLALNMGVVSDGYVPHAMS